MSLEGLNILSVAGFSFLLLILTIGYFFVEVVVARLYPFYMFRKYNNELFDRVIHYIFWGLVLNFIMFAITTSNTGLGTALMQMINSAGILSTALGFDKGGIGIQSQLVIFSISYFINLTIILSVIALFLRSDYFLVWIMEEVMSIISAIEHKKTTQRKKTR